jgi:predicted Zn finger-like uncharacterized protein
MIVTCPSCGRKFNLPDNAIKSPYQKLKCSSCSHIFMLTKEEPQPAEAERAAGPVMNEPATPPAAPKSEDLEEERPRKLRGPIILVIALVVLAAFAGGFYYYWNEYLGAGDRWLSIKNMEGQEIATKEGKVFFISGTVANGSTKRRKFLILRAKLFDKDGAVLAEKDIVAGLSFSKETVATMQKLDIEKKVNDFKLSGGENFQAGSGNQVPFSVVFFDEGFEKAKEFTIEIVESPSL